MKVVEIEEEVCDEVEVVVTTPKTTTTTGAPVTKKIGKNRPILDSIAVSVFVAFLSLTNIETNPKPI